MFDDVTEGILQFSFPDFMLLVYRNKIDGFTYCLCVPTI